MTEAKQGINKALLEAQRKIGAATKDAKNPHFKSDYPTFEAVLLAVKTPLNEQNIIITQPIVQIDGAWCVCTRLIHEPTGQTAESVMPIVAKDMNDPQKLGSAITYARRYTLSALVALPAAKEHDARFREDDDGNAGADDVPPENDNDEVVREIAKASMWKVAKKYGYRNGSDFSKLETFAKLIGIDKPLVDMTAAEYNTIEGKIISNESEKGNEGYE